MPRPMEMFLILPQPNPDHLWIKASHSAHKVDITWLMAETRPKEVLRHEQQAVRPGK